MRNWIVSKVEILNDGKDLEVTFKDTDSPVTRITNTMPAYRWHDLWMTETKLEEAKEVNNHLATINKEWWDAYRKQLINCRCLKEIEDEI